MKIVSLKCANCGASLDIGPDVEQFACGYCGAQQVVQRSGGIVSLRRMENTLREVKHGTDRTASELALQRLTAEAAAVQIERDEAIRQVKAKDESSSTVVGLMMIIGAVVSVWLIATYGWWAVPFVVLAAYIGFKSVSTASGKVAEIRRTAQARLAPLHKQIAHHRAIVDGYEPGKSS